jgi:hypothetical protein
LGSVPEEIQPIMEALMIIQGSGPMYQRGKHSLFIRRVVVRVGMEIEVGVCGFTVDYGPMSHRVYGIYINV